MASHADTFWPSVFARTLLFGAVWMIIADAEPASLIIGIPAIGFAAWSSARITAACPFRLSWPAAIGFAAFFLRESVRGGIDVASRTLRPTLRIAPAYVDYVCRLPAGRPRVLFANCVSLLPGTLTAQLRDAHLVLHVLDRNADVKTDLAALEDRIAAMFALQGDRYV